MSKDHVLVISSITRRDRFPKYFASENFTPIWYQACYYIFNRQNVSRQTKRGNFKSLNSNIESLLYDLAIFSVIKADIHINTPSVNCVLNSTLLLSRLKKFIAIFPIKNSSTFRFPFSLQLTGLHRSALEWKTSV